MEKVITPEVGEIYILVGSAGNLRVVKCIELDEQGAYFNSIIPLDVYENGVAIKAKLPKDLWYMIKKC